MKQILFLMSILVVFSFQSNLKIPYFQMKTHLVIDLEKDYISNPEYLESFFSKLHYLQQTQGDSVVKILHLGDSHTQMGYFPGEVRDALQARYGGKGIGIFFPNSLCFGYNPIGLDISSKTQWECEKVLNLKSNIPLGIVGLAMRSADSVCVINIAFKDKKKVVEEFTVFHETLGEEIEVFCSDGKVNTFSFSANSAMTKVVLNQPKTETEIYFRRKKAGNPFVLYGLSVNSEISKGINYNTFGVSGGQYKFLAENAPRMVEQMEAFKPDLLIISLGTNDAYLKDLTAESFTQMLTNLIQSLKKVSPKTEFILTTPPDTEFNKNKPVSREIVIQGILNAGKSAHCAVWNFNEAMGGENTFKKWQKLKLASKDGLHFNTEGYYLQGQLFNVALAKAMEKQFPGNGWLPETEKVVLKTLYKYEKN
jgi:lysophospholipase L1-like esterase